MLKKLFLCLFLFFISPVAPAANISLAWDQSTSAGVTGNNIYVGKSSGVYYSPIRLTARTTYTVAGLGPGTYFFAVTATDNLGNESGFSNEVSTTISQPPFSITSLACASNWYGVVCLASASQKSSAVFYYQKIGTNGWTAIIATPTETKTQHRAVVYFPLGTHEYYNYRWEVVYNGVAVSASGTFLTK
jgi:hypothetical protein